MLARESRAPSSPHINAFFSPRPFPRFFREIYSVRRGREKGGVSWSQATKGISILNPIGSTVRERERERETREQKRGLSLSPFFPFPFLLFPLDRSQTGSSLFSLATRGLEADTARGGHRPTIRYDRRGERSYLDSRGKNEAKKRGLLLIGDPTRRQIRRTASSSFYPLSISPDDTSKGLIVWLI